VAHVIRAPCSYATFWTSRKTAAYCVRHDESNLQKQLRDTSNLAWVPVHATQRVCLKPGYEIYLHIATPGKDTNPAQACSYWPSLLLAIKQFTFQSRPGYGCIRLASALYPIYTVTTVRLFTLRTWYLASHGPTRGCHEQLKYEVSLSLFRVITITHYSHLTFFKTTV